MPLYVQMYVWQQEKHAQINPYEVVDAEYIKTLIKSKTWSINRDRIRGIKRLVLGKVHRFDSPADCYSSVKLQPHNKITTDAVKLQKLNVNVTRSRNWRWRITVAEGQHDYSQDLPTQPFPHLGTNTISANANLFSNIARNIQMHLYLVTRPWRTAISPTNAGISVGSTNTS